LFDVSRKRTRLEVATVKGRVVRYLRAGTPAPGGFADGEALTFNGRMVGFGWQRVPQRCPGESLPPVGGSSGSELWLETITGRARRVAQECDGNPVSSLMTPAWDGRALLYYVLLSTLPATAEVRRYDPATGRTAAAPLPPDATAIACDGQHLYYERIPESSNYAEIYETNIPAFG
jgi:hypothetical protein